MTQGEFVEETSRIERFFSTDSKTKELTAEERKEWYEELRNMAVSRYRQIIRQAFRKCKFMPKLADIVSINEELPYQSNKKETTKVDCNKCKGLGLVFYKKLIDNGKNKIKYEYVAHCNCQNGLEYAYDGTTISDSRYKSKFYVPTAQQIGI